MSRAISPGTLFIDDWELISFSSIQQFAAFGKWEIDDRRVRGVVEAVLVRLFEVY
jgi:hypothetical protein